MDKYAEAFLEFRKKFQKTATHLAIPTSEFRTELRRIEVEHSISSLENYIVKGFPSDRKQAVVYNFSNAGILMMSVR